jgi:hypothetical protein
MSNPIKTPLWIPQPGRLPQDPPLMYDDFAAYKWLINHPSAFMLRGTRLTLRPYQLLAVQSVIASVRQSLGLSFVWIFPRQSGKDEALAQMLVYLLAHASAANGEMVVVNPTFKPQTETSMRRLEARLRDNPLVAGLWKRTSGYVYSLGGTYLTYMSADPSAHIVSATANRLLVVNEAQDVSTFKFDKDVFPMASSTNATRLFTGTRWTTDTLLERELRFARLAQEKDHIRRVFLYTADDVRLFNPSYGRFVDSAVARFGRQHPLVKTQYFSETVDAQVGLFPPERRSLMRGSHTPLDAPEPGKLYAFLIDVGGQDQSLSSYSSELSSSPDSGYAQNNQGPANAAPVGDTCAPKYPAGVRRGTNPRNGTRTINSPRKRGGQCAGRLLADTAPAGDTNPRHDSTFLKIVEVDLSTLEELGLPTYLVRCRREWIGEKHVTIFGAIKALYDLWKPDKLVIDATGVGEGLWSLLDNSIGDGRVIPVKFTSKLKSDLAYALIGMLDSGRYREYHPFPDVLASQMEYCRSEILPGPSRLMRWGVPDGARDPHTGEYIHDDDLITTAICTLLDRQEWHSHFEPFMIIPPDPLDSMDRNY